MLSMTVIPDEAAEMGRRGAKEKKISNLTAYVVSVLTTLVGLGLIFIASAISTTAHPAWNAVATNIGGALLTTGGVSILWDLFSRREFLSEVFSVARLSEDIESSGLCRISTNFQNDLEWPKLLNGARRINMFVSYARTWRRSNLYYLQAFARHRGNEFNLILPDPRNERVVSELARRFKAADSDIVFRINEAKDEYISIFNSSDAKAKLKIWLVQTAPVFSFYRIDDKYVIATYRHKPGQGDIVTLVCDRAGALTEFIDEEFDALTDTSASWVECVYPPAKNELAIQLPHSQSSG